MKVFSRKNALLLAALLIALAAACAFAPQPRADGRHAGRDGVCARTPSGTR